MRGRGEAGRDRLGVLVAGFAQVDVEVDEARRDDHPVGFDAVGVGAVEPGHRLEDAVTDDDLAGPFPTGSRVDEPGAADLEVGPLIGHAASVPACVPASR